MMHFFSQYVAQASLEFAYVARLAFTGKPPAVCVYLLRSVYTQTQTHTQKMKRSLCMSYS